MYRMIIDDNVLRYSGVHNRTIILKNNLYDLLSMFFRDFGLIDLYKKNNLKKGQAYTLEKINTYDNNNNSNTLIKLKLIVEKSYLDIVKDALENEGFVKKEEGFKRQLKR